MNVIGGDLGGTTTRLRLAHCDARTGCETRFEHDYASADYPHLLPLLKRFLSDAGVAPDTVAAACIAVAGPIRGTAEGQEVKVTNLPWHLDSADLARQSGINRVLLINDFEAVGYGIPTLGPEDLATLQAGRPCAGAPRGVLGAGTGLGQTILTPVEGGYSVWPTEGGHVDFAPVDDEQIALLRFLQPQLGRVCCEHLLSGSGLVRIHAFCCAYHGHVPSASLNERMARGDPAAAISESALDGSDTGATAALHLFTKLYGAQAGNFALSCLCRDGLYVAGGIAPKILPRLREGPFLDAFGDKGKMAGLMATIPVHVVTNTRVGLQGAVERARSTLAGSAPSAAQGPRD